MYRAVVVGNPAYRKVSYESNKEMQAIPAGPAIHTSQVIAKLGVHECAFIGCSPIGMREQLFADLDSCGIEERHLVECKETNEFTFNVAQDRARTSELTGLGNPIRIRDFPEEFLRTDCIILSPLFQEVDLEIVEWIASSSDARILWNPQLYSVLPDRGLAAHVDTRTIRCILGLVDMVQPNRTEAFLMTNYKDPYVAAETLVEWGSPLAAVTLDSDGSIIYDGEDFYVVPAYQTPITEPYGAGDAFMAAFALRLLDGGNLLQCGAFGTAAASFMIERTGCNPEMTYAQVKKRSELVYPKISIR